MVTAPVDLFDKDSEYETYLGDITYMGFFSPNTGKDLIWGVGPAIIFPNSTSKTSDNDARIGWGGSLVFLATPGKWVFGTIISDIVRSKPDSHIMQLQYFINYNFPKGWYLTSSPMIYAYWKQDADNRYTVPVGLGVGKLSFLGKLPVNVQLHYYHNVIKPDSGVIGDSTIRFQLQFLFPSF